MDLSIIIPSYNTKDLLDRCLQSVLETTKNILFSYEVIVVDNNSTDGSTELLNKKYKHAVTIFNKQNVGYGKANNIAIKRAKGDHILLLNSDCVVQGQALKTLLECSIKHAHSFIGGKLFNEDGSAQQSCGPFYTLPIVFAMLFLKGDQMNITRYSPKDEQKVDWVSGACLMGKKEAFEETGLFDETIFMYMEEIDLLYRAKKKGYHVWFCPHAAFTHTGAASSKNRKEPVINIYRGLLYFYEKHHSQAERAILKILLRLKAWSVIVICGIIGRRDYQQLYAKALEVLL